MCEHMFNPEERTNQYYIDHLGIISICKLLGSKYGEA